jgi:hypothetical protein
MRRAEGEEDRSAFSASYLAQTKSSGGGTWYERKLCASRSTAISVTSGAASASTCGRALVGIGERPR